MTEQSRRFFVYSRTNHDNPVEIADQSSVCAALVRSIGGAVTCEAVDFGSGMKTSSLPGYKRMIEAIKRGQVDAIVAADIERFGRSTEILDELFSLCARHDIEIWDASTGSRFEALGEWMVKAPANEVPPSTLH